MKDASTTLGPLVGLDISEAYRAGVDANFLLLAAAAAQLAGFAPPPTLEPATEFSNDRP